MCKLSPSGNFYKDPWISGQSPTKCTSVKLFKYLLSLVRAKHEMFSRSGAKLENNLVELPQLSRATCFKKLMQVYTKQLWYTNVCKQNEFEWLDFCSNRTKFAMKWTKIRVKGQAINNRLRVTWAGALLAKAVLIAKICSIMTRNSAVVVFYFVWWMLILLFLTNWPWKRIFILIWRYRLASLLITSRWRKNVSLKVVQRHSRTHLVELTNDDKKMNRTFCWVNEKHILPETFRMMEFVSR